MFDIDNKIDLNVTDQYRMVTDYPQHVLYAVLHGYMSFPAAVSFSCRLSETIRMILYVHIHESVSSKIQKKYCRSIIFLGIESILAYQIGFSSVFISTRVFHLTPTLLRTPRCKMTLVL